MTTHNESHHWSQEYQRRMGQKVGTSEYRPSRVILLLPRADSRAEFLGKRGNAESETAARASCALYASSSTAGMNAHNWTAFGGGIIFTHS